MTRRPFTHPVAGKRESAGATAARERGLRPLSEISRSDLAAAARLMGYENPSKAQIRAALSDSLSFAEWHHVERGGRVRREYFTTPMSAVGVVETKHLRDDRIASMIEEQRRMGAVD